MNCISKEDLLQLFQNDPSRYRLLKLLLYSEQSAWEEVDRLKREFAKLSSSIKSLEEYIISIGHHHLLTEENQVPIVWKLADESHLLKQTLLDANHSLVSVSKELIDLEASNTVNRIARTIANSVHHIDSVNEHLYKSLTQLWLSLKFIEDHSQEIIRFKAHYAKRRIGDLLNGR